MGFYYELWLTFDKSRQQIQGKLSGWKAKYLSFSNKLTLLKGVIQSIIAHPIINGFVPHGLLDKMEIEMWLFLWSRDANKDYVHLSIGQLYIFN